MRERKGQQEILGLNRYARLEKSKRGQQEILGFVLIVVLVVVGMLVFMVISLRNNKTTNTDSLEVKNMLDSVMGYTTDCALVFEPQFQSVEDLFKSSFEGKKCKNNGLEATDYLNSSLSSILETIIQSEAVVVGYSLTFVERQDAGEKGILEVSGGNCVGSKESQSAQRNLVSGSSRLIIRLKLCK